jgi:hypothetical protein
MGGAAVDPLCIDIARRYAKTPEQVAKDINQY